MSTVYKEALATRTATRTCAECGSELTGNGRGKVRIFCSATCKQTHANRMMIRGKALSKIALGWRQTRGSGDLGKFLFGEMTQMLDMWNEEDRNAGRMKADDYAAMVTEFNPTNPAWSSKYLDRRVR